MCPAIRLLTCVARTRRHAHSQRPAQCHVRADEQTACALRTTPADCLRALQLAPTLTDEVLATLATDLNNSDSTATSSTADVLPTITPRTKKTNEIVALIFFFLKPVSLLQ